MRFSGLQCIFPSLCVELELIYISLNHQTSVHVTSQVIPLDTPRKIDTLFSRIVEVAKPYRRPFASTGCYQAQHTNDKHHGKQRLRELGLVFSHNVDSDLQHEGHKNTDEGHKEVDANPKCGVQSSAIADYEARKENLNVNIPYVCYGDPRTPLECEVVERGQLNLQWGWVFIDQPETYLRS